VTAVVDGQASAGVSTLSIPVVDGDDVLTAALAYAAAGWYVGPLAPGTKNPGSVLGGRWQLATSREPGQIVAWFAGAGAGTGVFLHVGRSGGVVLDGDHPERVPQEWVPALRGAVVQCTRVQTGEGSSLPRGHFVFAMPPGRKIGNAKWPHGKVAAAAGEVRGVNGVIVVAPTVHESAAEGGLYRWVRTGPVSVLPALIADTLPDTHADDAATDAQVSTALATWTGRRRRGALQAVLERWDVEVGGRGASRHLTLVELACWAAREARAGLYPLALAVEELLTRWLRDTSVALGGGRVLDGPRARAEFAGVLAWAVGQALAADEADLARAIERVLTSNGRGLGGRADAGVAAVNGTENLQIARQAVHDVRVTSDGAPVTLAVAPVTAAVNGASPGTPGTPGVASSPVPPWMEQPAPPSAPVFSTVPVPVPVPAGSTGGPAGPGTGSATEESAPASAPATNLPAEFWDRTAALSLIRTAALSRVLSPDAVLGCVLARLSSFIRPGVRVDTGLGRASLNLAVVVVGDSSAGKSEAWRAARELLPAPAGLSGFPDNDGLPLGSGEGMAEAFYGMAEEGTGEEYASGPRKGQEKTKIVRRKMYDHACLFADEGEALLRMMERAGATVATEIRKAWKAETLGQANASAERKRIVPDGSYAMGIVLGFQPGTIGPLFDDAAGGTPQRFWFVSAHSDDVGDVLTGAGSGAGSTGVAVGGPAAGPARVAMWPGPMRNVVHGLPNADLELPGSAKDELRAARVAARRVGAPPSGLNGHRPLHLAKLAGLLAVLDLRDKVGEDDWAMAAVMWRTSCAVRDGLVASFAAERAERLAAADDRRVEVAARSALASEQATVTAAVRRVARRVALLVHDRGVASVDGRGGLRPAIAGRDRGWLDEAVREAVVQHWIVTDGNHVGPGSERPV
jgi:hypothetical protein